ncbi:MAG TPA: carbohydrate ABC transporter permease [Bacilli bacterium]|nr:carbohydrate ABC transporter permease [Bacilli bacterium]
MKKERKQNIKKLLWGSRGEGGIVRLTAMYALLAGISFIFLYPLLQMVANSFMSLEDLIDPTVIWLPSKLVFGNYQKAIEVLNYWKVLRVSITVALWPTIIGVASSAVIGYGFARHDFPGKKVWLFILVAVFLLPTLLMSIPTYVIYNELKMLESLKAYIYPALTGFGLRQSVFILIFYQFFRMVPSELCESAEVDGANSAQVFFKIAIPMVIPAFIICVLYSFVWYWNETTLAITYFKGKYTTLQIALSQFESIYRHLFPSGNIGLGSANEMFNQGVLFAGTTLSILPLIILYIFTQRWFVESADRAGIAGE